ncbi:ABC transporter permease [Croceibacterium sp. TMG7-5b_MA50]|uniref:ABC transporter permease n=1 Tax=Croceibacterium sp. TMG7-5b_MA50 TaxID=3121290 RepID=UPI0032215543
MTQSTMRRLRDGWRIQWRVIHALMIRELTTRFGRENIGFLWIMVEPLLFAGLVSLVWRIMIGPEEHGLEIAAFVISGYLPLTLFRHCVGRSAAVFQANGSLVYHRQVKILDFMVVRLLIELLGGMMAYLFIAIVLVPFDQFPLPENMGLLILGWMLYFLVTASICLIIAPLSEMSEVLEKFLPVTTYIMIPFSGTFTMASFLTPSIREALMWSPFVHCMEMMREGIWGDEVRTYYDTLFPIVFAMILLPFGLVLCRRVRRTMTVD